MNARRDEPLFTLEAGHDLLVLHADQALRAEEEGAVAILSVRIENRSGAGREEDVVVRRDLGAEFHPARNERLDACNRAVKIGAGFAMQLAGQNHRGIFRQERQFRALPRRLADQRRQVVA